MVDSVDQAVERTGEAYEFDARLTVVGDKLQSGNQAPEFALDAFDGDSGAMQTVRLADSNGSIRILNVVNSLDTQVCHVETRHWDSLRARLPPDIIVYTISMDLPFAQARWRDAESVEHQALSAHKDETFGRDYGVLLKEWRLLQRAVFVIDRNNRIAHADYVPDQMMEPDYDAVMAEAHRLADD